MSEALVCNGWTRYCVRYAFKRKLTRDTAAKTTLHAANELVVDAILHCSEDDYGTNVVN